jgi:negative regulator of sigma E activity
MIRRLLSTVGLFLTIAQSQSAVPSPSAEAIAARMEEMSQQRALMQPQIACERNYTLDYEGFPESKHAEMNVRAVQDGTKKEFTILSESGSSALRSRVLHRMLDTEREASIGTLHEDSRLIRKNYEFTLVGTETAQDRPLFVLAVKPRVKSKVAWSGQVWVDAEDYAVVRAEGHPDQMPSWWTTHADFVSTYQKIDGIWLPKQNVSETRVRFGGHAHLVIRYEKCVTTNGEHAATALP